MTEGIVESQPPQEKVNPFARIIGVLFSPTETFASIARKPDFVVPLSIFVLVSMISGWTMVGRVDYMNVARDAMRSNPQFEGQSAEQVERGAKMMAGFMKAAGYAAPLLTILGLIIIAGILFLGFRMFGGAGDFKQAFSTTVYAWYPGVIKSILAFIVLLNKKSVTIFDFQNPIRSNLAFLVNPKVKPLAFTFLSSIDLFSFWIVILTIIGFSTFSKLSRARSAVIVIVVWTLGIVLKCIGPAIQQMRMKP